ncbi:MAG: anthranilate synthase component I [Ferrovibrio sp.]|uniref:anthranilate synthase component I n=1 Tax=Ferrovibrio sp. TaxID=1917215 RepID=UPI0026166D08|nr:anthranilate synthase component I [Ferrovibrio sp.]MCW0231999.1 anthranilate synthase component I [Ferrovibrio sp.]
MKITPDYASFAQRYMAGEAQVLSTQLVADLETPVSAFLKLADTRPWSCLLESIEGGAVRGRYSIIGLKPDLLWRCRGQKAEINRTARFDQSAFEACAEPTVESLRKLLAESHIDLPVNLPPMAAGIVGFMGYDMVRLIEPRVPDNNPDTLGLPDGILMRPTVMAIFDSVLDMITVVTPVRPQSGMDARAAYALASERLSDIVADLDRPLGAVRDQIADLDALPEPQSNMSPDDYMAMVHKAKEYIAAGDVFQVVVGQRFSLPFRLPPFALYRALRRTNPSPFMFYLNLGGPCLVGSSPEILVRLRDETVTVRPIAGTRKRGATPAEDQALADDLLSDPKECAEHLMLLDLGRNDVGRVAQIGTVKVTERNQIERYSHVMHIVSNVEGRIRPDLDALDALFAGFPAGTVSGAPKVRAMEIIDELEPVRRSFYAGGVGYFSANGTMDTCITLRTALVKDGTMYVQAGAGIVADSDPMSEHVECVNKAKALIRAAEEAERYASRTGRGQ